MRSAPVVCQDPYDACVSQRLTIITLGIPINPDTSFNIRDGHQQWQYLDNAAGGAHVGITPAYANAGSFSLTRWPCGKYCWGGFTGGLGPTCPAEKVGMSFYANNPDLCIPITVQEIPCDVRDNSNNCLWAPGKNCSWEEGGKGGA